MKQTVIFAVKFNINAKMMWANQRYADDGAIGAALTMDPTQPVYL